MPGGQVDEGESGLDAVAREVSEETGLEISKDAFMLAYAKTIFRAKQNESVNKFLYFVRVNGKQDIELSWEHSSYKWVPVGELDKEDFVSFYREAIDYIISHKIIK